MQYREPGSHNTNMVLVLVRHWARIGGGQLLLRCLVTRKSCEFNIVVNPFSTKPVHRRVEIFVQKKVFGIIKVNSSSVLFLFYLEILYLCV